MQTNNKLRDALGKILWCLEWMFNNTDDKSVQNHLIEPIALAKAALAEPVRNYEVGTAEERALRFVEFCCKHHTAQGRWICHECPCKGNMSEIPHCLTKWAQMPYDEKKGVAE